MTGALTVRSTAFAAGEMIPERHTCDGEDLGPPLEILGVPAEARSIAVICDDPDSPHGTWLHWSVWDIPPDVTEWEAGFDLTTVGAREGKTSWPERAPRYYGPCPGKGTHRYFFRVYALDRKLGLGTGAPRDGIEAAMDGHVLAEGSLMGRYIKRANR